MLIDDIRSRLETAVRERDEITRDVLRVVLGEMQTLQARSGKPLTDDEGQKVIRKVVEGNVESIGALKARASQSSDADDSAVQKLTAENVLLNGFLPQTLSPVDIRNRLAEVSDQIAGARSDGQAIGLAMKHLKGAGVSVLGEDVKAVVAEIRSATAA